MMLHLAGRKIELEQQVKATRQKLTEAQQIVNQLTAGCIQLEARLEEIGFLIEWHKKVRMAQTRRRKRPLKPRPAYKFIRFNPLHKEAMFMMPQLVTRVRDFIADVTPEIDANDFVSYILTLAQEYPDAIRMWLALDKHDKLVGHLIVTADVYLSEIFLHVQQLAVDEPQASGILRQKVLKSMYNWVKALNVALANKGARQISRLYLTTASRRNMAAWERYMPGVKLVEERKLGIFELPSDVLVSAEVETADGWLENPVGNARNTG